VSSEIKISCYPHNAQLTSFIFCYVRQEMVVISGINALTKLKKQIIP